jgi:hypothetical protein
MRKFKNSTDDHWGLPLPRGRLRLYRQDTDGQSAFVGEDIIDHTPRDESVRVRAGNAFDWVGKRRRTNFKVGDWRSMLDDAFEIQVRNPKIEPVEIRSAEHLYRWSTWEITEKSHRLTKTDLRTIGFCVKLAPGVEAKVTYHAHYARQTACGRYGTRRSGADRSGGRRPVRRRGGRGGIAGRG